MNLNIADKVTPALLKSLPEFGVRLQILTVMGTVLGLLLRQGNPHKTQDEDNEDDEIGKFCFHFY